MQSSNVVLAMQNDQGKIMNPVREEVPQGKPIDTLLFILVIAVALILLIIQAVHFFPFFADDAFISLRYSQRLLEGKGLTWSDGQRVEGYTNLLWVLLCAGLGRLGMDLVLAGRLIGMASTAASFGALVTYLRETFPPSRRPMAAICSLIPFGLSASVAVWMVGGLEQALLVGLLSWALIGVLRFLRNGQATSLVWASLLLAGVTLTRADGFIFPLSICVALLIAQHQKKASLAQAFIVLSGPAVAYLSQLAFRLSYYGEWLPNTAYVKVSFTLHRVVTGLIYIAKAVSADFTLVVLGALGCIILWRLRSNRSLALLYLIIGVGTSVYLIVIGGDIFPAVRHFLAVILVLCFAASHASVFAYDSQQRLRAYPALGLALLAVLVVFSRHQGSRAFTERWEWQNKELGLYIKHHYPPNALLVSDSAGATVFYSEVDAIDPLGLNDYHIAHLASSKIKGEGELGHELGDGKYVLDHNPDIIVFGWSGIPEPKLTSDSEIVDDPRFQRDYELQHWKFDKPVPWISDVYVRRKQP